MPKIMDLSFIEEIKRRGVVAVLEIEQVEDAVPCAKALVDGGISCIELALRTKAAAEAIKAIKKEVPSMLIGAGTVISSGQAKLVKEMGADFAVAPGLNPKIMNEALSIGLPFAPGVATASDIEQAIEFGCKLLKLFPAGPLGGVDYLKAVSAPYKYLDLQYFPLGGISQKSLAEWAEQDNVFTIGGSWIAKRDLIKNHDWKKITELSQAASNEWKKLKNF